MTIDHPYPQEDPSGGRLEIPPCHCRRCGRVLQPGRGELYVVSILAVADPYPPVYTEADLALDVGSEIRRLVRRLASTDADEARDEVYRREVFHLCVACYQRWIDQPARSE
ncbi:MAG: hypothetical protein ACYC61_24410 [Isosphaeraceae bacterium]